jgi:hypothetical protein
VIVVNSSTKFNGGRDGNVMFNYQSSNSRQPFPFPSHPLADACNGAWPAMTILLCFCAELPHPFLPAAAACGGPASTKRRTLNNAWRYQQTPSSFHLSLVPAPTRPLRRQVVRKILFLQSSPSPLCPSFSPWQESTFTRVNSSAKRRMLSNQLLL